MLKMYCSQCGNPNIYSINKPKFCTNCGHKFDLLTPPHVSKQTDEKSLNNDEDDGIPSIDYVPNISSLDFEVLNVNRKNDTIRDIIGTSSGLIGGDNSISEINGGDMNKNFLDSFRAEAGAIRPRNRTFKNNANKKD